MGPQQPHSIMVTMDKKGKPYPVCQHFVKGGCNRGKKCRFLHSSAVGGAQPELVRHMTSCSLEAQRADFYFGFGLINCLCAYACIACVAFRRLRHGAQIFVCERAHSRKSIARAIPICQLSIRSDERSIHLDQIYAAWLWFPPCSLCLENLN